MKEKSKYLIVGTLVLGVVTFVMFFANSILYKAKENIHAYTEKQHGSFVEINQEYNSNYGTVVFYYDVDTKIIWVELFGSKGRSFSPYYVVSEDGESEMAVLDKNYFIE